MQNISSNILEYRESAALLKGRIQELNEQIREADSRREGPAKQLMERRGILYTQLTGIEYAIRALTEYQNAVSSREVKLKIG